MKYTTLSGKLISIGDVVLVNGKKAKLTKVEFSTVEATEIETGKSYLFQNIGMLPVK